MLRSIFALDLKQSILNLILFLKTFNKPLLEIKGLKRKVRMPFRKQTDGRKSFGQRGRTSAGRWSFDGRTEERKPRRNETKGTR